MSTLSTITHQKKLIKKDTGFSPVSYFAITDDIYASDGITNTMHNFATIETTLIASKAYAIGEFLVYGGILYKITTAITNGGTIIISPTNGYNVIQDNIGNEITQINNNIPKQSNFITPSKSFVAQWSGHAIAGQCVDFGAMSVPTNAVIYGAFFTPWANITQSINLYYAGGHVYCYSPAYTGNVGYSALVFYTV